MAEASGTDKIANDDATHVVQVVQTIDAASKSSQSDIQVNIRSKPTSTKKTGTLLTYFFKKKCGRKCTNNKKNIVRQKNKYKIKGIIMK